MLSMRTIVGVTDGSDRGQDLLESEMIGQPNRRVLRSGIAVMDQLAGDCGMPLSTSFPQRHPQRDHDQVRFLGCRGVPSDDPLGEYVDDERDVNPPGPGSYIGEIGDPNPVRGRRGEVTVEQIASAFAILRRDCGPDALIAADTRQPEGPHGAVDRPGAHIRIHSPVQHSGHFPPTIKSFGSHLPPTVGISRPHGGSDRIYDVSVGDRPSCRTLPSPGSVGSCGDLAALLTQNPTDRLETRNPQPSSSR